jgi:Zn-dependent peptidase ImmA (M78 family)
MHTEPDPLDREQERQANMFASAFLMPADQISRNLQRRAPTARDWPIVLSHRKNWGVSAKDAMRCSRRCRCLGDHDYS